MDHPVQSGAAAPYTVPINTLAPTSATVGGQPANVLFSGLAPRFVGLAQVNVQIPDMDPGARSHNPGEPPAAVGPGTGVPCSTEKFHSLAS